MAEYIVNLPGKIQSKFDSFLVNGNVREEVIRCRDCKKIGCPLFLSHGQDPNGFCAWGRR